MTKPIKQRVSQWGTEQVERRMDRKNYPAAPSAGKGILKLYEDYFLKAVGEKKKAKVLVLGATPELRDLVLKHSHELVAVDISIDSLIKWGSLMKYKNHPNEIIIKCNWLNMPLENNCFDLIMGDGPLNNIPLKDHHRFFKEIKRILKPGGFVILRETTIDPKRIKRKLEEIDSDFLKGRIHWFDLFFDCMIYSDISNKCYYNFRAGAYDLGRLIAELKKAYSRKRISEKSLKLCSWCVGSGSRICIPKLKAEKTFNKYFKLIPVKQAKDYKFTQDTMIFFFGRKDKI